MEFLSSLRTRLVLSHLAVSLVSIILISAFAGNAIFTAAWRDIELNLEDLAFATSNTLEQPLQIYATNPSNLPSTVELLTRLFANHPEIQYTVYLTDGTPIVSSSAKLPTEGVPPKADRAQTPEVLDALENKIGQGKAIRKDSLGQQTYYLAVKIQRENQALGVLRLETAIQPALSLARRSFALLLLVAFLVALGVSLFGWLLANTLATPIQDLTQAAERMAQGELGARVEPTGPPEMRRLVVVFNVMAGRLQDHVKELRAFVANASHELRTPLTVVKLRAEALRTGALEEPGISEQFLSDIENEVDRLSRMVNDLLDLSRLEAGLVSSQRALLNLGTIAAEVHETFSIRAAKAGVSLEVSIEPDLPLVKGNEDQLRRVLYNFVDNAIKFTPSGGQVQILVGVGSNPKIVRLIVNDTGLGILPDHLPHVFERFYRVDATRPRYFGLSKGSGLGLAIAKSIVESHGGKIGVDSQFGKGASFWAELPTHT